MATISEIAQMCSNVYDGSPTATEKNIGSGSPLLANLPGWEVLFTSNDTGSGAWNDGYFAVAYYNTTTNELIIANRGTDYGDGVSTFLKNLFSDAQLGLGLPLKVQQDAVTFAQYVISNLRGLPVSSLIESGHSLGGSEAQAALSGIVASKESTVPDQDLSGVLFNSPGIGGYQITGSASSYNGRIAARAHRVAADGSGAGAPPSAQ